MPWFPAHDLSVMLSVRGGLAPAVGETPIWQLDHPAHNGTYACAGQSCIVPDLDGPGGTQLRYPTTDLVGTFRVPPPVMNDGAETHVLVRGVPNVGGWPAKKACRATFCAAGASRIWAWDLEPYRLNTSSTSSGMVSQPITASTTSFISLGIQGVSAKTPRAAVESSLA